MGDHPPATGLLCGFYAVILSLGAQMPDITPPTVEELMEVYDNSEIAVINDAAGETNKNYFSADQIAGTVHAWGASKGLNLQLGCYARGVGMLLFSTPTSAKKDVRVLLIYNDNADALYNTGINHYSGLRICPEQSESDDSEAFLTE